ncbi:hypothetical protein CPB84DRAFT_1782536 [Gymnopilus junonius]|uniref:Secreted protein n=1 Tax=Gymnopilus junonius TaxID=109634 RepID=A0A9P5NL57_GYMJU|nr:hypothetical protein CPB84DRAFT_1782536 [Gymnopilus junonius]
MHASLLFIILPLNAVHLSAGRLLTASPLLLPRRLPSTAFAFPRRGHKVDEFPSQRLTRELRVLTRGFKSRK